jgi:3-methylcrotonyl-CoA carboxylase alpha subunit
VVDAITNEFFFLEMNTRIQVEHPVTEMITGLDLVGLQVRLARGEDPNLDQAAIRASGHAIELRIYAEDPSKNFMPSPGLLKRFRLPPADRNLRIDTGVCEGDRITFHYDPMIAKIIGWDETRGGAIERLESALGALDVEGVQTNVPFLRRLLGHDEFRAGDSFTTFIQRHSGSLL